MKRTRRTVAPSSESDTENQPPAKRARNKPVIDAHQHSMARLRALSKSSHQAVLTKPKVASSSKVTSTSAAEKEANAGLKSTKSTSAKSKKQEPRGKSIRFGSVVMIPCGTNRIKGLPYFQLSEPDNITALRVQELNTEGMAAINFRDGFYIKEEDSFEDIMEFVSTHLSRPFKYLEEHLGEIDPVPNPYYKLTTDPKSHKTCPPFILCVKDKAKVKIVPGSGGLFPDGRLIVQISGAKRKGSWTDNHLIFLSLVEIPHDLRVEWSRGNDPDPCDYVPSSRRSTRKGKGKAKAVVESESESESHDGQGSGIEEADVESGVEDNIDASDPFQEDDLTSSTHDISDEDVRSSSPVIKQEQRQTRSMTSSAQVPSSPAPINISSDDDFMSTPELSTFPSPSPHPPCPQPSFITRSLAEQFRADSIFGNNVFTSGSREFNF
ncbi:hypothetical protein VKT23_019697 [Stygiomarasmius scandens]|uniref:Uncharacterized protein n=1 Tax=Marasmiellus scandens TaxID=2682957 RepID=A0ABR1INN6_9AGAR